MIHARDRARTNAAAARGHEDAMEWRFRKLLFLAVSVAAGCSSAATTSDGPTSDGAAPADAPADAPSTKDAAAAPDAHVPSDASTMLDASATADAGKLAADPSPGTALCGHGTFAPADALALCQTPPSNPSGPTPARCDALATTGGRYEVWCGPSATEIFVWFDALRSTGQYADCYGSSLFMLGTGEYRWSASPSLGGNGVQMIGHPTSSIDTTAATDVRAKVALGGQAQGAVRVWLTAMLQTSGCGGANVGPATVMLGAEAKWSVP